MRDHPPCPDPDRMAAKNRATAALDLRGSPCPDRAVSLALPIRPTPIISGP
jgi:hypothetical protein